MELIEENGMLRFESKTEKIVLIDIGFCRSTETI